MEVPGLIAHRLILLCLYICRLMLRVSSKLLSSPITHYCDENLKVKFGVSVAGGQALLTRAKELGANVVGLR